MANSVLCNCKQAGYLHIEKLGKGSVYEANLIILQLHLQETIDSCNIVYMIMSHTQSLKL